jgi:hypothetical protein
MKIMLAALVMLCVAAMSAQGQVMLRVIKNENTEVKDRTRGTYYSSRTSAETLSYSIEVTNAGQAAVEGVEIKWAILLKPRGSGKPKLVEGTKMVKMERSEKQTVETDPIQTRESYRSTYSNYNYDVLEEVGHSVEVIAGGKTIASEFKPMDIKPKIEAARRVAEPKSEPPVTPRYPKRSKQ